MQNQIRPWMLTYTIIFALLSISFVYNNFTNQYPFILIAWACICYIVIFVGNILFSLNRVPLSIRTPWKVVFPILVLQFVFSALYDLHHGKHAQDASATLSVIAFGFGLLVFLPTLRAHYLIGFGKDSDDNVAQ